MDTPLLKASMSDDEERVRPLDGRAFAHMPGLGRHLPSELLAALPGVRPEEIERWRKVETRPGPAIALADILPEEASWVMVRDPAVDPPRVIIFRRDRLSDAAIDTALTMFMFDEYEEPDPADRRLRMGMPDFTVRHLAAGQESITELTPPRGPLLETGRVAMLNQAAPTRRVEVSGIGPIDILPSGLVLR